jgi:CDK-activating kinase assembly factor MAT1
LKKRGFHKAFFQDLGIEREVDIRRRVMQVFNKRQEDFETLGDWNNYLESVEDLVFKITDGTPPEKEEAEQALKEYAEMNRREIEENLRAEREEEETAREAARAAEERAKARREQMRRQDEKDRNDIQKIRKQALEAMGSGGDAEEITRRAEKLILVKKEARRKLDEEKPVAIRGLKKRKEKVIDLPYDPFGGLYSEPTRFVLQDRYPNDFLKHAENDMRHMAGGYSLQEYYQRSLYDAMAGLVIFIGEEKEQESAAQREPQVSLPDRTMQDVF